MVAALARDPAKRLSLAAMAAHPWLASCGPAAAASAGLEAELLARHAAGGRHSPRGGKGGARCARQPNPALAEPCAVLNQLCFSLHLSRPAGSRPPSLMSLGACVKEAMHALQVMLRPDY